MQEKNHGMEKKWENVFNKAYIKLKRGSGKCVCEVFENIYKAGWPDRRLFSRKDVFGRLSFNYHSGGGNVSLTQTNHAWNKSIWSLNLLNYFLKKKREIQGVNSIRRHKPELNENKISIFLIPDSFFFSFVTTIALNT